MSEKDDLLLEIEKKHNLIEEALNKKARLVMAHETGQVIQPLTLYHISHKRN